MAYYHPCRGCVVDVTACERRINLKAALTGLNVTSIKFNCEDRKPKFHRGQRVTFPWSVCVGQDDEGEDIYKKTLFNGTITQESSKPSKFTVRVDHDGVGYKDSPQNTFRNGSDVVNVKSGDIELLREPERDLCGTCFAYAGEQGRCHSTVRQTGWDKYRATPCLRLDSTPPNRETDG